MDIQMNINRDDEMFGSHSCSSLSLAVGHVLIDQQIIEGGLPSILFLRHPIGNIVHNNKNCDPMLGLIQISICDAIIDDDKDELRERKGKTKGYVSLALSSHR